MSTTFDREAFYHRLDKERRARRKSWRQIGRETGVASATFTQLGQGHALSLDTLAALLAWVGETDLAPYIDHDPVANAWLALEAGYTPDPACGCDGNCRWCASMGCEACCNSYAADHGVRDASAGETKTSNEEDRDA